MTVVDGVDLATLPVDQWPTACLERLKQADPSELLRADARGSGVRVGQSTIRGGGRGVFATRDLKVGEHIMPFFGQIVYDSLEEEALSDDAKQRCSRYGTAVCSTTALNWAKTAVEVQVNCTFWEEAGVTPCPCSSSRRIKAKRGAAVCQCHNSVWIAPGTSCAAGVVNDYRSVHDDDSSETPPATVREPNAVLDQAWDPVEGISQLTKAGGIYVLVTAPIMEGEEVCLDYGEDYNYF